jgi:hypothetical protein
MAVSILFLVKCMYCIVAVFFFPGLCHRRQIRCTALTKATLFSIALFLVLNSTTQSLREMLLPVLTYLTSFIGYLTSLLTFASIVSQLRKLSLPKFPPLSRHRRISTAKVLTHTITIPTATTKALYTKLAAEAMQATPDISPLRTPATHVMIRAATVRQSPRPRLRLIFATADL